MHMEACFLHEKDDSNMIFFLIEYLKVAFKMHKYANKCMCFTCIYFFVGVETIASHINCIFERNFYLWKLFSPGFWVIILTFFIHSKYFYVWFLHSFLFESFNNFDCTEKHILWEQWYKKIFKRFQSEIKSENFVFLWNSMWNEKRECWWIPEKIYFDDILDGWGN